MKQKFIFHGIFLILVAVLAVMYNPHTHSFGFNPDAKSALFVGGAFAVLSFAWAYFDSRGAANVALKGGLISTILLVLGCLVRAIPSWGAYSHGETTKWFSATTITLMIVGSVPLLSTLLKALAGRRPA